MALQNKSTARQTPALTPIGFCSIVSAKFTYWYLAIPILFVLLKLAGIQIFPTAWADVTNYFFGKIYPASLTHYNAIKVTSPGEAANYAMFLIVIILFHLFIAKYAITKFRTEQRAVANPGVIDFFYFVIGIPLLYYVLVKDAVKFRGTPFWDFYVDGLGFYYVRQEVVIAFVLLYGIFLIIFAMKVLKIWRSPNERQT